MVFIKSYLKSLFLFYRDAQHLVDSVKTSSPELWVRDFTGDAFQAEVLNR